MTNFPDRNTQRPGYDYDYSGSIPGNSPMWIIGALVVALVLGGLWYGLSGPSGVRSPPSQGANQPTTQPAAPTNSPTPKP
jgi:hypothetical protein